MLPKIPKIIWFVPLLVVLTACSGLQQSNSGGRTPATASPVAVFLPTPTPMPPGPSATGELTGPQPKMQTFRIPTPVPATPTPSGSVCTVPPELAESIFPYPVGNSCSCPLDTSQLTCQGGEASSCTQGPEDYPIKCSVIVPVTHACRNEPDGVYCIGKPVIYLYPQKDTRVNVSLQIPGTITDSIPTYPIGGWQNILAHPSGIFDYQGKSYRELFYESAVQTVPQPDTGVVLKTDELSSTLPLLTGQLGLKPSEQQEFVQYWLPKLQALNSPYILFSVLSQTEKDGIDHVTITPKPDTFIDFLVYFKPLQAPIPTNPLVLPQTPQRVGFTAVEWGGTIAP